MKRELKHKTKLIQNNKLEERFTTGNAKEAWQSLNTTKPAEIRFCLL